MTSAEVSREFRRIARSHKERSVFFSDRKGALILVTPHRSPRSTCHWRVTWFDADGEPMGHALAVTHRDAMDEACAYGAIPATVRKVHP